MLSGFDSGDYKNLGPRQWYVNLHTTVWDQDFGDTLFTSYASRKATSPFTTMVPT